jgi:putative aldouronate transport system permease protein
MASSKKLRKNQISPAENVALNVFFVGFCAVIVVPILLLVIVSLTDRAALVQEGYRFLPERWSFEAYRYLFSNPRVVRDAYGVTILVTTVGTAGHIALCALTAYPLTKRTLPGLSVLTFIVFFTMLFHGGLVATYIVSTRLLGFRNHFRGLILPLMFSVWHVLIFRTFFKTSIPASIEESAKMDGASDIRVFFQIVLPISKPVVGALGLFAALAYWNDWFQSLLYISNERMYSLQFVMLRALRQVEVMKRLLAINASQELINQLRDVPGETIRFAMVVVSIGPIVFAYPFFQRYFVKGITIGAIKG